MKKKTSTYVRIDSEVAKESKKIFKEKGFTVSGGIEQALREYNKRHGGEKAAIVKIEMPGQSEY